MASHFYTYTRATARAALLNPPPPPPHKHPLLLPFLKTPSRPNLVTRVSNGVGDSYLDMWKKAVDRERNEAGFRKVAENLVSGGEETESPEALERKNSEFQKLLEVDREERDRVQRLQVIDRAAAAIAAAKALVKENPVSDRVVDDENEGGLDDGDGIGGDTSNFQSQSSTGTPGPDFWSWTPPDSDWDNASGLKAASSNSFAVQAGPVIEIDRYVDYLSLPLESKTESKHEAPLPPLQSLIEVEKMDASGSVLESPQSVEKPAISELFSTHAEDAVRALGEVGHVTSQGTYTDGSKWWKETGLEQRPDGVICRWTLTRGVSADKAVEWEEKYWEAADDFEYKELGSEKSGRDAAGNVWREFWKESMYQVDGSLHIEKTADKWGKNGKGDEWQEQWSEHYGAGQAEKWAHKWCSIDPTTQLDAGHAHIWHERWGEKYDGQGGSTKYTDKWAERSEGDGWTKWGDKWDEHFDPNGHGVKQGETWWEGKYGERWNRTWGEGHNGSGWVHKYGKSSCGEHWDTHVQQDTWYERYPHYGFYHCFENSVSLRNVKKPTGSS